MPTFACWLGVKPSSLLILHLRRLPVLPRSRTEFPSDILHASEVEPRADKHHKEVEHAKGPKDPIVQPLVTVEDVEPGRKFVTIGILTEFAETIGAILYVAAGLGNESGAVGLACLTWWRRESREFGGGANDGAAMSGD